MRWLIVLALTAAAARGELHFPKTLIEEKVAPGADKVTSNFEFVNKGKQAVRIRHYDAACSCMSVQTNDAKLEYAPGEKGIVRTVFDLGNFSGVVDKQVAIWVEGDRDDNPSIRLTVRVNIPELVKLEPKTLKWTVGENPSPKSISIKIQHEQPIRVTAVSGTNENFKQELITVTEGKLYQLKVTPLNLNVPGIGVLRIDTDSPIARHKIQQAFVVVSAPPVAAAAPPPAPK